MSFPGFNISKSTPTTSTSNENSRVNPSIEKELSTTPGGGTLFGMALHSSPIIGDTSTSTSSPPFRPSEAVPLNSVTQTLAIQDVQPDQIVKSDTNPVGLLGLFDKFDVKSPGECLEPLSSEVTELNEKSGDYEDDVVDEKIESIIDQLNLLELREMIQKLEKKNEGSSPVENENNPSLVVINSELNQQEDDSDTENRRRLENALLNLTDEEEEDVGADLAVNKEDHNKVKDGKEDQETVQKKHIIEKLDSLKELTQTDDKEATSGELVKDPANAKTETRTLFEQNVDAPPEGDAMLLNSSTEDQTSVQNDFSVPNDSFRKILEDLETTDKANASPFDKELPLEPVQSQNSIEISKPFPKKSSTTTKSSSKDPIVNEDPSNQHQNIPDGENHQMSHRPFDFQRFLLQLRSKSADPIVRYIRSFLVSFTRQAPMFTTKQKIKIIRDFKAFMNEKFTLYEPFASMDDIDLENSREGLEKLLMNRLYDMCFPPSNAQINESEIKKDDDFSNQVEKFSWVNGKHLDVDLQELSTKGKDGVKVDFIDYSIKELNKINNYRAPRDKIICVLNLCKIIFGFLKTAQQETNADSFVPLLILVILKSKTDHLISNIQYIENYRGEEWLNHGETGYYLSSLQGAIGFIENLSFDQLSITQDEFDAHMEAWEAHSRQLQRERKAAEASTTAKSIPLLQPAPVHADMGTSPGTQMSLSPSTVLFNSAEMVSKSLSNFLSPSPQPESPALPRRGRNHSEIEISTQDTPETQEAFQTLVMMFPNLDKAVLQDLVYIKRGNVEECVDTCLELVSET